ncbi:MAG TPA: peptide deformylase, partial [Methylophilaceae bacterium]|nr:peptide deformylase [Methylophilaceae bacterium]
MAILSILNYPDPRLHTIAKPIEAVDNSIRKLIDDMAETMYAAPGIGLAATQVNRHLQLILVDISETKDSLKVFINPKIIESSGQQSYEEGCLSVPDV